MYTCCLFFSILIRYVVRRIINTRTCCSFFRYRFRSFFFLGVRGVSSLGNPTCEHTGVKRLKIRGDERLQRSANVRCRRGHFLRPERSTGRVFHHHISVYFVLFHGHPFLGVHTESE